MALENRRVMVTRAKLSRIGDAIRGQTGTTESYSLDDMPDAIRNISRGRVGVNVLITTDSEEFYGLVVTLTDGTDTLTSSFSNEGQALFEGVDMSGRLTASVEYDDQVFSVDVVVQTSYTENLNFIPKIYGATWAGGSSPAWTRTDDAVGFADPVPAVGTGEGSSPFDYIMPWAGMVKVTHNDEVMVAIPKFYYKISMSGSAITVQISNSKAQGFHTSPAHIDRGDGRGERDVIYVGRYKCRASDWKSAVDGTSPKSSVTIADARTAIHNLGSNIWLMDFATLLTIKLLYIVEFANFNCRETVGRGALPQSNIYKPVGRSDVMQYHTGSVNSKTTTGTCVQYRNIEDMWSNGDTITDGLACLKVNDNWVYRLLVDPNHAGEYSNDLYAKSLPWFANKGRIQAYGLTDAGQFPLLYPSSTGNVSYDANYNAQYTAAFSGELRTYSGEVYHYLQQSGDYNYWYWGSLFSNGMLYVIPSSGYQSYRIMELP